MAWHPFHHEILTSGGSDGTILYWALPDAEPVDMLEYAHEGSVWSLDFHPLGHTLVSGSNDHTTRFWSRGRPGVKIANDKFHIGKDRARELGIKDEEEQRLFLSLSFLPPTTPPPFGFLLLLLLFLLVKEFRERQN